MYRMPEKQSGSRTVLNCARSCFQSMQITYPITYFPLNWNILTFLYHFSIWFVSFYIILCKLSSFMRIYAFKRKKTSRKRCVYNHGNLYQFCFTYAYMQITVNPPDFAGDKNIDFEFPNACLLGTLFILAIKILKAKLQTFHSNVLMRESYEKCCNWLKSRNTL